MERHPTDFVELLFGLAFLATGGGVHRAPDHRHVRSARLDCAWRSFALSSRSGSAFLAVTFASRPSSATSTSADAPSTLWRREPDPPNDETPNDVTPNAVPRTP